MFRKQVTDAYILWAIIHSSKQKCEYFKSSDFDWQIAELMNEMVYNEWILFYNIGSNYEKDLNNDDDSTIILH